MFYNTVLENNKMILICNKRHALYGFQTIDYL